MSFGCKIFDGFEVMTCQSWNYEKNPFKYGNLHFKIWLLVTPESFEILKPKLMEKLPTLVWAIEEKLVDLL